MCLYHPNGKLKVFQDIVISIANSAFISSDCTVFFKFYNQAPFEAFKNSVVLLKNGF